MSEQKAKARAAWAGSGETKDAAIWFDLLLVMLRIGTSAQSKAHDKFSATEIRAEYDEELRARLQKLWAMV